MPHLCEIDFLLCCYVEPGSWQEFKNAPTLLRFVGHLGLDAALGMDLFCLIGIALSFAAFVSRQCRNFIIFTAMWMLYLSVYYVSFQILFSLLYNCQHIVLLWLFFRRDWCITSKIIWMLLSFPAEKKHAASSKF